MALKEKQVKLPKTIEVFTEDVLSNNMAVLRVVWDVMKNKSDEEIFSRNFALTVCQKFGKRFVTPACCKVVMQFVRGLKAKMAPNLPLSFQHPVLLSMRITTYCFQMMATNVLDGKFSLKQPSKALTTRFLGLLTCDFVDERDPRVNRFIEVAAHSSTELTYLKGFFDSIPKNTAANTLVYMSCREYFNLQFKSYKVPSMEEDRREIMFLVEKMIVFNDFPFQEGFNNATYQPNPRIFESVQFLNSQPLFVNIVKEESD